MAENYLYYGDNLDFLRSYIKNETQNNLDNRAIRFNQIYSATFSIQIQNREQGLKHEKVLELH